MTGRDFVALSLLPSAHRRATRALAALPPSRSTPPTRSSCSPATARVTEATPPSWPHNSDRRPTPCSPAHGLSTSWRWRSPMPTTRRACAKIPDAPVVLWVVGCAAALSPPGIAIVGSRAASAGGLEVAERLGHDLAAAGVPVVSGLARGCDGAAHRGALAAGGATIAVLGCGADVVYPAEHRALYRRVRDAGAIVSEFPPGTPPLPAHFPQRNRIISGLARGVVVVEASEKSGSLITAACALEQGRDVMAVPGSTLGSRHRGCHALLRDGARLVETAADVLEELGIAGRVVGPGPGAAPDEDALLTLLGTEGDGDLDLLAARSGLPVAVLLQRLLALELTGRVRRVPGGRFVRARG